MKKDSKIYVAGHKGLVGSAILEILQKAGHYNIIVRNHEDLDLTRQSSVESFFKEQRPEYIFLAAAKVGGIWANKTYPAEFIFQNLSIQTNVIHNAFRTRAKKLIFLGSSCIYPRECPQPICESYLLTGPLEETNDAYAVAKIAGIKMCQAYNRQYGTRFLSIMPTNLYGPNDNFDLTTSHVIPALIRKFHEAKLSGTYEVIVWGSGTPRREFLHSSDLAEACLFLMKQNINREIETHSLINIGYGSDITIRELAEMVKNVTGYHGKISYDQSKPDGTPQKLLDSSFVKSLGWAPKVPLRAGLDALYQSFLGKYSSQKIFKNNITLGIGKQSK